MSQCFQKSSAAEVSKCIYRWERVKHFTTYNRSAVENLKTEDIKAKIQKKLSAAESVYMRERVKSIQNILHIAYLQKTTLKIQDRKTFENSLYMKV